MVRHPDRELGRLRIILHRYTVWGESRLGRRAQSLRPRHSDPVSLA